MKGHRDSFQLHEMSSGGRSTGIDRVGVTGALGTLGWLKVETAEDSEFLLGTMVAVDSGIH